MSRTNQSPALPDYRQFSNPVSKATFSASLWCVERLLDAGHKKAARKILLWITERDHDPDAHLRALVSRAWIGRDSNKRITRLRFEHLNNLMRAPLRQKNYPRLLYLAARYEALGKNWPVAGGDLIARQLVSEKGVVRIRDASKQALKKVPGSAYLTYLNAVTTAKSGDPVAAGEMLEKKLTALMDHSPKSNKERKSTRRQFNILRDAWRMVDLIAREETRRLDGDGGTTYVDLAQTVSKRSETADGDDEAFQLIFKEPLLQSRNEEAYVELCSADFESATTTIDKLRVIREMLRHAVRRQISYHHAYSTAGQCLDQAKSDLDKIVNADPEEFSEAKQAKTAVETIVIAVEICRKLKRDGELDEFKQWLRTVSHHKPFMHMRWLILSTLATDEDQQWREQSLELRGEIDDVPERPEDLKHFLRWALFTREFEDAEAVFNRLPAVLQTSQQSLYFVNILQRQSRFIEALQLIKRIHAYMLAKPVVIKPVNHWNLVRRYGELKFLQRTSQIYLRYRQPRNPVGVLLIAPRNIDQLRKYPLVMLGMLKRRGWAVVPLVEGLLPVEATGDPEIDLLQGCITLDNGICPSAEKKLPELKELKIDIQKGKWRWGEVDLAHSMLEDARISRRAFNVDLTCPALTQYLEVLSKWATRFAQATAYADEHFQKRNLRCGLMSLFNSRMPDSLFREYCDVHGDPDNFFCLHTANGYENYFSNFKTNISTRCVVRNMTRYKHVRVSSMPVPEIFEKYYENHSKNIEDVLVRIEDVANIRRTTAGEAVEDPAMLACRDRIMAWRERGGKVACLLGRVVCDSMVPFDGGPAHKDLSDWLNHTIDCIRGTDTLLLIKPHPHELNEQIGTYLNEYFIDLIKVEIPDNVEILGHKWFDIQTLREFVDIGVIYNSTAAIELALQEIPAVLCGHFAPLDYPVGHIVPSSRQQYRNILQFRSRAKASPDLRARAAMWLQYMSASGFVQDYRYHSRPTTNKVVYPPYWVEEDVKSLFANGDRHAAMLARRAIGETGEPHL